jgi:hypothetical protein
MTTLARRTTRGVGVLVAPLVVLGFLFFADCTGLAAAPSSVMVAVTPTSAYVKTSASQAFTATVQNDAQNEGVEWSVFGFGCNGVTCGTLSTPSSASGVPITYNAPASLPFISEVTVVARSVADPHRYAAATVLVTSPALMVTITPNASSVELGQKLPFTATASNNNDSQGILWKLTGPSCGGRSCGRLSSIFSPSGSAVTYTAPPNLPTPASVTLTATSVADFTKSATATITLLPAPGAIVVTPSATSANVSAGTSQNFAVSLLNDSQNQGVTWKLLGASCSEQACGSISAASSASGAVISYTAPTIRPEPASIVLQATSVTDTSKAATITINID